MRDTVTHFGPTPKGNGVHTLYHCCGIFQLGGFILEDVEERITNQDFLTDIPIPGTGMFIATFINTPPCVAAKKQLDSEHTLLYQSPVQKNNSTWATYVGQKKGVMLCVYMHKDTPLQTELPIWGDLK